MNKERVKMIKKLKVGIINIKEGGVGGFKEKMTKNCECCRNEIKIVFPSTKFCTSCSLYLSNLKAENYNLKLKLKTARKTIEKLKNDICRK